MKNNITSNGVFELHSKYIPISDFELFMETAKGEDSTHIKFGYFQCGSPYIEFGIENTRTMKEYLQYVNVIKHQSPGTAKEELNASDLGYIEYSPKLRYTVLTPLGVNFLNS